MSKILLVDDDPLIRAMLTAALENVGHLVTEAVTGRDALRLLREQRFDILVSDIFMPDMDGLELIHAVRRAGTPMRVVAMSAGSPKFDIDFLKHAQLLGADVVLPKPVCPKALRESCA